MIRTIIAKTEPLTRFSQYLALVTVIFTCTFFVYRDFGVRMLLGYAVLCAILAVHLVRRIGLGQRLQLTPLTVAFLFLSGAVLLSFLRPDARLDSDTAAYLIAMLIGAAYLVTAQPSERELHWVMRIMWGAFLFFCAFVLFFEVFDELFWVTLGPLLSDTAREYLLKVVPNGYGFNLGGVAFTDYILFFGLANACGELLTHRRWNLRCTLAAAAGALALFVILIMGRRGELLAALAMCCIFFVALGRGKHKVYRLLILVGMAAGAVALVFLCLPLLRQVDFLRRYVTTLDNLLAGKDISAGRFDLYALAIEQFLRHPLFGIGWGRFADLVTPVFKELHGDTVADVHNIYLQFLCETGIVGAILLVTPMAYIYIQTFRQTARIRPLRGSSREIDLAIRLNGVSLALQSFFLTLGMLDPCFTKYVFWSFYALAVMFSSTALRLEGFPFPGRGTRAARHVFSLFAGLFSPPADNPSRSKDDPDQ